MPKLMTRRTLVKRVHEITGFPKRSHVGAQDIETTVSAIVNALTDHLASGGSIELRGLGTFKIKVRNRFIAQNPRNTSQKFEIPTHNKVEFKAAEDLKRRVIALPIGI